MGPEYSGISTNVSPFHPLSDFRIRVTLLCAHSIRKGEQWLRLSARQLVWWKVSCRDYPGSPVVKTLPSNTGCVGSIPGQGAKILHVLWLKNENMKQKQYCIKFNKGSKKKKRAVTMKVHVKNWESTMKINVSIFFFFTGMERYKSIHLLYISFRVYIFFILLLLRKKGPQLSPVSTILNSAPSLWLYIKNHQRSFKKIFVPECIMSVHRRKLGINIL